MESYAPPFLKLWASDSMAALVADVKGRSDALNLRGAGACGTSGAVLACSVLGVAILRMA
jgi:hypothetical protein